MISILHKLMILLLLFSFGCSGSFSELTKTDIKFQLVMSGLTCYDWRQTLEFTEDGIKENNFVLGKYPSEQTINTLIPLAIAGQWLVTWILPPKHRRSWQLLVLGGEAGAIKNNIEQGYQ